MELNSQFTEIMQSAGTAVKQGEQMTATMQWAGSKPQVPIFPFLYTAGSRMSGPFENRDAVNRKANSLHENASSCFFLQPTALHPTVFPGFAASVARPCLPFLACKPAFRRKETP